MTRKTLFLASAVAASAVLSLGGAAYAATASPTQDTYSGTAGQQQAGSTPPPQDAVAGKQQGSAQGSAPAGSESNGAVAPTTSRAPSGAAGTLPFTGLELGFAALVGAALLGTGLVLRRGVRAPA